MEMWPAALRPNRSHGAADTARASILAGQQWRPQTGAIVSAPCEIDATQRNKSNQVKWIEPSRAGKKPIKVGTKARPRQQRQQQQQATTFIYCLDPKCDRDGRRPRPNCRSLCARWPARLDSAHLSNPMSLAMFQGLQAASQLELEPTRLTDI